MSEPETSILVPVKGKVVRTLNDRLNFVELEPNPLGIECGLLAYENCANPPRGYLKDQASVFRIGDQVTGYLDPNGTHKILKAAVTPTTSWTSAYKI